VRALGAAFRRIIASLFDQGLTWDGWRLSKRLYGVGSIGLGSLIVG
jgi:hypothetical protein